MDRSKMIEMAKKMKEAETCKNAAVKEAAALVTEELLTREEATKCVAGAMLKVADDLGLNANAAQSDGLGYVRLLIDQAVDGVNRGLKTGVHV